MNSRPKNPKYARNKNVLVIGGSGSGKTRFFVKPNLMQLHSSYVVTDPKGTLVLVCGKMLERNGYEIKILNTINFKKSMKYNPFAYLKSEKDILKLVQTIIANTKGEGEKAGEDFWVKAEKLYYTALIGYIFYEAPKEEQNFTTLLAMIDASEVREEDENFKNAVDYMFEALEKEKPNHFAVKQYKKYKLAFDAYLFQILENKQKYISQIMTSKTPVRVAEDVDEATLNYAEIKALATGNPLIKEKMDLDVEVSKLKMLEANFKSNLYKLEDKIHKSYPKEIERLKTEIAKIEKDVNKTERYNEGENKFTSMTIDGKKIKDKKIAGEELLKKIKKIKVNSEEGMELAEYRNFKIYGKYNSMFNQYAIIVEGSGKYYGEFGTDPIGNITRLDNILDKLPERIEQTKNKLNNVEEQLENAKIEVKKEFPQRQLLHDKNQRLLEVNHLLDLGEEEAMAHEDPLLKEVKEEIINFLNAEYDEKYAIENFDDLFPDLSEIGIAHTTTPDEKHQIQVNLDIENYKLSQYVDDTLIYSLEFKHDPKDASSTKELAQISANLPLWDFQDLVYVDPEVLKEKMGYEIDDDGNYYDPLSKDMDLDGVVDRYDADFRDNEIQEIGDIDKKSKSVMNKINEYQAKIDRDDNGKKVECSEKER